MEWKSGRVTAHASIMARIAVSHGEGPGRSQYHNANPSRKPRSLSNSVRMSVFVVLLRTVFRDIFTGRLRSSAVYFSVLHF